MIGASLITHSHMPTTPATRFGAPSPRPLPPDPFTVFPLFLLAVMAYLYVVVMVVAPILYGIQGLTIGGISALFTIITQTDSIVMQLSSSTEEVRVARYLLAELADLLNDDMEHLKLKTTNTHEQA